MRALFLVGVAMLVASCGEEEATAPKEVEEEVIRAAVCPLPREVSLTDLPSKLDDFHIEVVGFILKEGYGCGWEKVEGSPLPMLTLLEEGEVDVTLEIWRRLVRERWEKEVASGRVVEGGVIVDDRKPGWYVPLNVHERGVHAVGDLVKKRGDFANLAGVSLFYDCVVGKVCRRLNRDKFAAYGLERFFTRLRLEDVAQREELLEDALKLGDKIVFHHIQPSRLDVKYELRRLREPAYDPKVWAALEKGRVNEATAYPVDPLVIGMSAAFARDAPELVLFLSAYRLSADVTSEALLERDMSVAALAFLRSSRGVWEKWVSGEVSRRLDRALEGGS